MRLWAFKTRGGGVAFAYRSESRFDEHARRPLPVGKFDFLTIPRGTQVVVSKVRRGRQGPAFHERDPGVFDAVFVGLDRRGRARLASTVERATRLAIDFAWLAVAADPDSVSAFLQFVRRDRASQILTRMVVALD